MRDGISGIQTSDIARRIQFCSIRDVDCVASRPIVETKIHATVTVYHVQRGVVARVVDRTIEFLFSRTKLGIFRFTHVGCQLVALVQADLELPVFAAIELVLCSHLDTSARYPSLLDRKMS